MSFIIRKAVIADVDCIFNLITPFIVKKILLPRTKSKIQEEIGLTWVSCQDTQVNGCVNLTPFGDHLYEIRALAVDNAYIKVGIGRSLLLSIEAYIIGSIALPVHLFALTYQAEFFIKNGFQITEKNKFPQKIYDVCKYCSKRDDCKEIAVDKIII